MKRFIGLIGLIGPIKFRVLGRLHRFSGFGRPVSGFRMLKVEAFRQA